MGRMTKINHAVIKKHLMIYGFTESADCFSIVLWFSFAFWELSDLPIDSNVINTINAQKRSKDIGKIIHVTSRVQP